jgi:hypothetical protein
MKIRNIIVTLWFEKYNNMREIFDKFNNELNEYFPAFNWINLPANVDPMIPRISARSRSGHSTINLSNINMQLVTNYDEKYNEDFKSCLDYIEERTKKIYSVMIENNFKILYSAILVNLDKDVEHPIEELKNNLFNKNLGENNFSEIGMKSSMQINDKFYKIIALNNSKEFTMKKEIKPGNLEIIMPLISLADAELVKEYISINYELNDKFSFDKNKEYNNSENVINEMFDILKDDLNQNIEEFINTGKMN